MALSTTAWVTIAAVGGVAALSLASGAGSSPQRTKTKIPKPQPIPPPTQQAGPQPDPQAPNDPDRGRFFVSWGASFSPNANTKHQGAVLKIADGADGIVVVDMWLSDSSDPHICSALRWQLDIADGRLMKAVTIGGSDLPKCQAGSSSLLQPLKKFLDLDLAWQQEGAWIVFLWTSNGTGMGVVEDDAPWFSPEGYGAASIYVDLLWRFLA